MIENLHMPPQWKITKFGSLKIDGFPFFCHRSFLRKQLGTIFEVTKINLPPMMENIESNSKYHGEK